MVRITRLAIIVALMIGAGVVGRAPAASLVRVDPVGDGAFETWQDGNIAMCGPRYDLYHNLLDIRSLGNDAWTGTAQGDHLFGSYGVGVSDPVYYPALPWLSLVNGSTFTYLTLTGSGSIGGGEMTAVSETASSDEPANHLQMSISQTLYLDAHPQTWQNDPGNTLGGHDNELITLQNDYSCSTVNKATGGYILFRLDPVFNEQVGDVVPVSLQMSSDASVSHRYGNEGYTGYGEASADVLVNGQQVLVDENGMAQFNAAIGDVIAVKLSSMVYLRGSAVIEEPDNPVLYNRVFNPVHVLTWTSCLVDIPVTVGTNENAPLMPDQSPINPGNPYVFSGLDIGDSGVGIDSPLWIDPAVALGYDFEVIGGKVSSLVMPSCFGYGDTFSVFYYDPDLDEWFVLNLDAEGGEQVYFPFAVNLFYIGGLEDLELDPLDTTAFPVGLIFDGAATGVTVNMTPYVAPEPTSLAMLALAGLGAVAARRRGRKAA